MPCYLAVGACNTPEAWSVLPESHLRYNLQKRNSCEDLERVTEMHQDDLSHLWFWHLV